VEEHAAAGSETLGYEIAKD